MDTDSHNQQPVGRPKGRCERLGQGRQGNRQLKRYGVKRDQIELMRNEGAPINESMLHHQRRKGPRRCKGINTPRTDRVADVELPMKSSQKWQGSNTPSTDKVVEVALPRKNIHRLGSEWHTQTQTQTRRRGQGCTARKQDPHPAQTS